MKKHKTPLNEKGLLGRYFDFLLSRIFQPIRNKAGIPEKCPPQSTFLFAIRHFFAGTAIAGFYFPFIFVTGFYDISIDNPLGQLIGLLTVIPIYVGMIYFYLWSVKLFALGEQVILESRMIAI